MDYTHCPHETSYSGRTTAYQHIVAGDGDEWRSVDISNAQDCIKQQITIFEVQWSNCPVEVAEEVRKLWRAESLPNDIAYFEWSDETVRWNENTDEDVPIAKIYPVIAEYLSKRGVTSCLIHYWW